MAEALWTTDELLSATGGTLLGTVKVPLTAVTIDSRAVRPGDIFVAIKGDKHDGHDFVAAALKAGAGLGLVSRVTPDMLAAGAVLELADDPLRGLENIGRAARARSSAQIVAVTGSVGKTSTKEMLLTALSASGETHASAASFNNHWGVPLTLARMPRSAAFGVFEIGMNHAGEITPLVGMVRPQVAIITTIAASHLGNFSSLDGIADAKAEIFTGVVPGGHAVISRDTPYFERLSAAAWACGIRSVVSFGRHPDSDVRLERVALLPDCCCVTADVMGDAVSYRLGLPGEHMAVNSLAVLAAAKLTGADLARAAIALASAAPAKGRGVRERLSIAGGELKATMLIPLPLRQRLVSSGQRSRRAAAAASRCSATCWNWVSRARNFTRASSNRWTPPRSMSYMPQVLSWRISGRAWPNTAAAPMRKHPKDCATCCSRASGPATW